MQNSIKTAAFSDRIATTLNNIAETQKYLQKYNKVIVNYLLEVKEVKRNSYYANINTQKSASEPDNNGENLGEHNNGSEENQQNSEHTEDTSTGTKEDS